MLPSIDAIAEMKVTSANAESDTGFGNAGQINISIKSGTRQFHGVATNFCGTTTWTPIIILRTLRASPSLI